MVTIKGYWLSAAWFRLTARPFVLIDGTQHQVRWGVPTATAVEAGPHEVAGGIRYPGFSSLMGVRNVVVQVPDGETVELTAKNGLFNSEPFYVSPVR